MRKIVLTLVIAGLPALALAEQPAREKPTKASAGKHLPLKGAARGNACAEYGAGFVKLEGSDTCVKIGGYVGIGAGAPVGAR
jgi:hypothetical protein